MANKGIAFTSVGVGIVFLWSAVHNQKITTSVGDIVRGQKPPEGPGTVVLTSSDSSSGNTSVGPSGSLAAWAEANAIGNKYSWGGSGPPPKGWDCSGMVYRGCVDTGTAHPPALTPHGPVTGQWYTWPGAVDVNEPVAGDLCCWLSHMGIYVGGGEMISALNEERGTQKTTIAGGSPGHESFKYRRIKH